jgi:hypothetical protein
MYLVYGFSELNVKKVSSPKKFFIFLFKPCSFIRTPYSIIIPFSFSGGSQLNEIVVLLTTWTVKLRGMDGTVFINKNIVIAY